MITFKQFLTESKSAPLYHGTLPYNAVDIIKSNVLADNTTQFIRTDKKVDKQRMSYSLDDIHMRGVSLTRSFKFAWRFVVSSMAVVFEFDQQKIAQNNKIIPYSYWSRGGKAPGRKMAVDDVSERYNEYEEFVIGPIKNLDRKIVKIHANPRLMREKPEIFNHSKLFWDGKFVNRRIDG